MTVRPRHRLDPVWFQVMYQLAAQRSHSVLAKPPNRAASVLDVVIESAGGTPLEHVLMARARTRPADRRARIRRLEQADAEASELLRVTLATRQALARQAPLAGLQPDRRVLFKFLNDTVELCSVILLAGIRVERGLPFDEDDEPPPSRAALLVWLDDEVTENAPLLYPGGLIAYVLRTPPSSPRVEYNIACFFASLAERIATTTELIEGLTLDVEQLAAELGPYLGEFAASVFGRLSRREQNELGEQHDEHVRTALTALRWALRHATPEERAELLRWSPADPTLRGVHGAAFDALLREWGLSGKRPEVKIAPATK